MFAIDGDKWMDGRTQATRQLGDAGFVRPAWLTITLSKYSCFSTKDPRPNYQTYLHQLGISKINCKSKITMFPQCLMVISQCSPNLLVAIHRIHLLKFILVYIYIRIYIYISPCALTSRLCSTTLRANCDSKDATELKKWTEQRKIHDTTDDPWLKEGIKLGWKIWNGNSYWDDYSHDGGDDWEDYSQLMSSGCLGWPMSNPD